MVYKAKYSISPTIFWKQNRNKVFTEIAPQIAKLVISQSKPWNKSHNHLKR